MSVARVTEQVGDVVVQGLAGGPQVVVRVDDRATRLDHVLAYERMPLGCAWLGYFHTGSLAPPAVPSGRCSWHNCGMDSPVRLWRTVVCCCAVAGFLAWQVASGGFLSRFDMLSVHFARSIPKNRDFFEIMVMAGLRGIILTVCLPWLAWRS